MMAGTLARTPVLAHKCRNIVLNSPRAALRPGCCHARQLQVAAGEEQSCVEHSGRLESGHSSATHPGARDCAGHPAGPAPGPSGRVAHGVASAAAVSAFALLAPDSAAASESASAGILALLERLQEMGPYGPLLFVVTVACAELIPLFPTQPLSLASGLLFGPRLGAALIVAATSVAATTAFFAARGILRPLAEKVVSSEMRGADGPGGAGGAAARQLQRVNDAIEAGGWWEQFGAIALLRLTPVVPFSASNYLLGLSPLRFAPYITGTLAGMAIWSTVYATLGSASRALLQSGVEPDVLLADLADKAGAYTEDAAVAGLVVGGAVLLAWASGLLRRDTAALPGAPPPPAEAKDEERLKDRV